MAELLGHDDDNPRLSLPFPARLLVLGGSGFAVGGALGAVQGARRAAQVFRAENTHRAPTTMRGWYFYRKTKNYRALHGGMAGGARLGARVAAWVGLFAVFEHAVDRLRRRTDALGSIVAGLGLSGCFALLRPSPSAFPPHPSSAIAGPSYPALSLPYPIPP